MNSFIENYRKSFEFVTFSFVLMCYSFVEYISFSFRGEDYAERRKQVIQESKYLGGDMEHTHLVKGLDYALLEKVRFSFSLSITSCTFIR